MIKGVRFQFTSQSRFNRRHNSFNLSPARGSTAPSATSRFAFPVTRGSG